MGKSCFSPHCHVGFCFSCLLRRRRLLLRRASSSFSTSSSTNHHHSTSSPTHPQHNTINTASSNQHYHHSTSSSILNTTPSTQHHQITTINTQFISKEVNESERTHRYIVKNVNSKLKTVFSKNTAMKTRQLNGFPTLFSTALGQIRPLPADASFQIEYGEIHNAISFPGTSILMQPSFFFLLGSSMLCGRSEYEQKEEET